MTKLTCKEVTRLISEGLDRELDPGMQARLRAHYALCTGCAAMLERLQFLHRAMRKVTKRGEPD
jgi:hypothetical protein